MNSYSDILTIESNEDEMQKVEDFLRRIFDRMQFPEESFNKVLLCVSEAVINSIEHGNRHHQGKYVNVFVNCYENDLIVEVKDEGEGFDYKEISDPTSDENIRNERGRGIFIIRSLSNELMFKDKGNCVKFKIELH